MDLYPGGNPTPPPEIQQQVSLVVGLIISVGMLAAVAMVGVGVRFLLRRVLGEEQS